MKLGRIVAGCIAAALCALGAGVTGCLIDRRTGSPEAHAPETVEREAAAAPQENDAPSSDVRRVGGDREAEARWDGEAWVSGGSRIDTPLPEGYPPPTPPGAIEIKSYPAVRRAEVSGRLWPDVGMNVAFFPLFNHIQRREIAMTSPVEMDYERAALDNADAPGEWTMSFLYRYADQGPTGVDEGDSRVEVVDAPPVTVVSIGLRGSYSYARVREGVEQLAAWFDENPAWSPAGTARALHYNGPDTPTRLRWLEVQIPVRAADNR